MRRLAARAVRRVRHGRPKLSIVVLAAGGDPGRLHATLASVRDQASPEIELVVVAFGGGEDVARAAAADDTRARFLTAGGRVEARVRGISSSRGSHVLVASAGDLYAPGAIADLVPALSTEEVLLLSDGPDEAEPSDLRTRPDAARAPYLGRLVLPRDRADALLPGTDDADGMPMALAALSRGFTPTPYAAWRDDRGAKPRLFTVRHDPLPDLDARIAADRESLAGLTGPAREQRALGALAALHETCASAEGADEETWALLSAHAALLVGEARDQLESLDVVPRVLAVLAAEGRREDLVAFATRVTDRRAGEDLPTEVVGSQVLADVGVLVPDEARVVGEHESALVAQARRFRVTDRTLELELFVGVRHVHQIRPPAVAARLVDGERSVPLLVRTGSDAAVTRWMDETEHDHDAGLVTATVPAADVPPGAWEIHLDWADGDLRRTGAVSQVAGHGSASRPLLAITEATAARLRARHGRVVLHVRDGAPTPTEPTVSRVEVLADGLRLTTSPDVDAVRLVGGGLVIEGRPGSPGFWTVPLEADPWGTGVRPLPSGGYRLRLLRGDEEVAVVPSVPLTDRLPEEHLTEDHRLQLQLGHGAGGKGGQGLVLRVDAPLADDELGIRARWVQRARYLAVTEPLDDRLVYLQSFTGQGVGDHPRAIAAELRRRRPDLDLRWVVSDRSAPVPDGLTPLLWRSRDWYDALARAGHLVVNVELERWFRRRPGQEVLQTFHGYPSKAMGLGLWESRNLLPSQVRLQLEHSSGTWNNLLTPDPSMDVYYRRDYAYDGTILALGSPRNDELVGPDAPRIREQARSRLGIAPGQRALLYAPTWRDDLATNYRVADAVHHLDVERAAAALGQEWVLLLRGHRFHAATGAPSAPGARILDVTTYPEINELILAADAAVLDYSSLRFDFALTGRPMVFLVPDLEEYTERTRGFLWDYRETTPGPLVATTDEVVAALRDLDGLATRHAADLVAFNARYNSLTDGHAAERVVEAFFSRLLG